MCVIKFSLLIYYILSWKCVFFPFILSFLSQLLFMFLIALSLFKYFGCNRVLFFFLYFKLYPFPRAYTYFAANSTIFLLFLLCFLFRSFTSFLRSLTFYYSVIIYLTVLHYSIFLFFVFIHIFIESTFSHFSPPTFFLSFFFFYFILVINLFFLPCISFFFF